ncbi:hypothetical protein [Trabulsiella odontotermitis]|uniref:hypothetical protein n=1 Tax=Trabulsiella odontotermitis TaxID=379893 RepID=UPI000A8219C5|nr:hypothetical protein [Trabulsiella odontotermitis]
MKLEINIIYEWSEEAKKMGGYNHLNYYNQRLTAPVKKYFIIEDGQVYEHTVCCPILSDIRENTLLKVETINEGKFIVDTDCEWPDGVSPQHGYIPEAKGAEPGALYFYVCNNIDIITSRIEFNAMRRQYNYNASKNPGCPLVKITIIK